MNSNSLTVLLFIDNNKLPIAELKTPVSFELNTHELTDGEHKLKIVSQTPEKRQGVKEITFVVRNGPSIDIEGLRNKQIVDGNISLMVNAYDNENQEKFIIEGSETPKTVPGWFWVILIGFLGWAAYYTLSNFKL